MKRKLEKGESQLQAGTRNPNVNTKHFLGGGWEEGKGEEQVEEKSGRKASYHDLGKCYKYHNCRLLGSD